MTIGIYAIINNVDGICYVGKSVNVERRLSTHKGLLKRPKMKPKQTNRKLFRAVKKHGIDNFTFSIIETFDTIDESLIAERELYWIDFFENTGGVYNLRRDSSSCMIVHDETRKLLSLRSSGKNNPNYGNKWDDHKKQRMSELKSRQHSDGVYGADWRSKISVASSKLWSENPDLKRQMALKVKAQKHKYNFVQMNDSGDAIKVWDSIDEILEEHPDWKWQNIYSVCNGYKKRIYGFKWEKVLRHGEN